jgi:hypothetical protein
MHKPQSGALSAISSNSDAVQAPPYTRRAGPGVGASARPSAVTSRILFWSNAAAFGALWGAIEITLGSFVHALHIPFSSALLAAVGVMVLVAQRRILPVRGLALATAVVAAVCKSISPGGIILGPMIAILFEGLLIELSLSVLPSSPVAAAVGGSLAALWCALQKLIGQLVLFGATVVELYLALVRRAFDWLGLPLEYGWWAVGALLTAVALVGAAGGLIGWKIGGRAREALAGRASRSVR